MKNKVIIGFYVLCLFYFAGIKPMQAQRISPFISFGEVAGDVNAMNVKLVSELLKNGYMIKGNYNPARRGDLSVIIVSSEKMERLAASLYGKSMLIAPMKIGLEKTNDSVHISLLNPEYQFHAFLGNDIAIAKEQLLAEAEKLITLLESIAHERSFYGGEIKATHLQRFRYSTEEPLFSQATEAGHFTSFNEAIEHIEAQWKNVSNELSLIFRIVDPVAQKAVFGVAMHGVQALETELLSVFGDESITLLPYEIVVEHEKVYVLPVSYRFTYAVPEINTTQFKALKKISTEIEQSVKQLVH